MALMSPWCGSRKHSLSRRAIGVKSGWTLAKSSRRRSIKCLRSVQHANTLTKISAYMVNTPKSGRGRYVQSVRARIEDREYS